MFRTRGSLPFIFVAAILGIAGEVLHPPYFNVAEYRKVTASATCGEEVSGPELYCKLGTDTNGQDVCDYCDPEKAHPPGYAIDAGDNWWQSPPLSRGEEYQEVNFTIHLGQEFDVASAIIKMGNSPRPKTWILEKSTDYGETYVIWRYFAESKADCLSNFGPDSVKPPFICETSFSNLEPSEGGEIDISLLKEHQNADNFSHSDQWTKATNIRLRLLRLNILPGHSISDSTVARKYFYSIANIKIIGRCVCNGFAAKCDLKDHRDPDKLLCRCEQNTCGSHCERCCPGFQKKSQDDSEGRSFVCEKCYCNQGGVLPTTGCGRPANGEDCKCKERVTGLICNECKPLNWNLNISNPLGCQDCKCDLDNTVSGMATCAGSDGQCICKPNVGSRECSRCIDGTYQMDDNDLFGCRGCLCNIGGSVNNVCDKQTGQCPCKPGISGRQCDRPLNAHYFPSLFQYQFEIEDGRTTVGTQVRYGYDENVFPGFSWRGYAVFSDVQKEVLLDIDIEKPSLYKVLFHYLNFGTGNVHGTIKFTPKSIGDVQQKDVRFNASSRPKFCERVFNLNPDHWTVSIRVEEPLLLDYMVMLPQAYYEAKILRKDASSPCTVRGLNVLPEVPDLCLFYKYLPFKEEFYSIRAQYGYVLENAKKKKTLLFYKREVHSELDPDPLALIGRQQNTLNLNYCIKDPGPYVVIVTYLTKEKIKRTKANVYVKTSSDEIQRGTATFYDCRYKFLCRLVVLDDQGDVMKFSLEDKTRVAIKTIDDDSDVAIEEVVLVPENLWHIDYVVPKPQSIWHKGFFIKSDYPPVSESTDIRFKSGYEMWKGISFDQDLFVVNLKKQGNAIDLRGSISTPGLYAFIVHYYQTDHPSFEAQVFIEGTESHEAVLPLPYCPRASACRTLVHSKDTHNTFFHITKNYQLNIRQTEKNNVWFQYVLAIPSKEFRENLLEPIDSMDGANEFLEKCFQKNLLLPRKLTGFCLESALVLSSGNNDGTLSCECDPHGSLSSKCQEYGGECECKPHIIGRTCSQCRSGYFGFPNCKPCNCSSTAHCQPVTGQCVCPPGMTGDRCNACLPYAYGFDLIIGYVMQMERCLL